MQQYIWFPYTTDVYVEHFNTSVIDLRDDKGKVIPPEKCPAIKVRKSTMGSGKRAPPLFDGASLYDDVMSAIPSRPPPAMAAAGITPSSASASAGAPSIAPSLPALAPGGCCGASGVDAASVAPTAAAALLTSLPSPTSQATRPLVSGLVPAISPLTPIDGAHQRQGRPPAPPTTAAAPTAPLDLRLVDLGLESVRRSDALLENTLVLGGGGGGGGALGGGGLSIDSSPIDIDMVRLSEGQRIVVGEGGHEVGLDRAGKIALCARGGGGDDDDDDDDSQPPQQRTDTDHPAAHLIYAPFEGGTAAEPAMGDRADGRGEGPTAVDGLTSGGVTNAAAAAAAAAAEECPHLPTSEGSATKDRRAGLCLAPRRSREASVDATAAGGGGGGASTTGDGDADGDDDGPSLSEEERLAGHVPIIARQALRHILYSTIRDVGLRSVLDGCLLPPPLRHPDLHDLDGTRPYTRAEVVAAARQIPREMVPMLVGVPLNFALATGVYDARLRAAIKRLAHLLDYGLADVLAKEEVLCSVDVSDIAAMEAESARNKVDKKRRKIPFKRIAAIGGFSVLGAVVLVVTGGLAAPILAPALTAIVGAAVTTVGAAGAIGTAIIGSSAAAAVFAAVVGAVSHAAAMTVLVMPVLTAANLTAIFGVGGAGLAAYRANKRLGALCGFKIRSIEEVERHEALALVGQAYTEEGLERLVADSRKLDRGGRHSIEDDVTRKSYQGIIVPAYVRSIALVNLAASSRFRSRRRVLSCAVESRLPASLQLELAALKLTAGVWAHVPPYRIPCDRAGLFLCHNRPKYPTGAHGYVCYRVAIALPAHTSADASTTTPRGGTTTPPRSPGPSNAAGQCAGSCPVGGGAGGLLNPSERAVLRASIWVSMGVDFSGKETLGCTIRLGSECPLAKASGIKKKKRRAEDGGKDRGLLGASDAGSGAFGDSAAGDGDDDAHISALLGDEEGYTADDALRDVLAELGAIADLEENFVKRLGPLEVEGRLKPKPHVIVRLLPEAGVDDNGRAVMAYFHERELKQQMGDAKALADKEGSRTLLAVVKNSMTDPNNDRSYASPSEAYGRLQLVTVRTLHGRPAPRFMPPTVIPLRHACIVPYTNKSVLPSTVEVEAVFMGEAPPLPVLPSSHASPSASPRATSPSHSPSTSIAMLGMSEQVGASVSAASCSALLGELGGTSATATSPTALAARSPSRSVLSRSGLHVLSRSSSSRLFYVTVRARVSTTNTLTGAAVVTEALPPRRGASEKDEWRERLQSGQHETPSDSPYARIVVSFDEASSAVIFEVKDPLAPGEEGANAEEAALLQQHKKRAMTISVAATGYITVFDPRVPANDQQVAVWQPVLSACPLFSASEQYVLEWEEEHQRNLFGIVGLDAENTAVSLARDKATKLVVGKAKSRLMKGAVFAVFSSYTALWGTLEMPLLAVWASNAIDNSFASLRARAKLAGRELAAALLSPERGNRPVTLTGYSFGANVMFECLLALFEANALSIVEDVYLLGACLETDREKWRKARQAVGGRLVNVYNRNDWYLWLFHRLNTLGQRPLAGLCQVSLPGVENVDASADISAHGDYAIHLSKAFSHIPLQPTPVTCRVNTGGSAVGAKVPAADILNAADRVMDAMSTSIAVMLDCGFVLSYTNRLVVDGASDFSTLVKSGGGGGSANGSSSQSSPLRTSTTAAAAAASTTSQQQQQQDEARDSAESVSGDVSLVFIGEVCYGCQFDFSPPPAVDTGEAGVAGLLCPVMSKAPCCVSGYAVHMGALSDTILIILVFLTFNTSPLGHSVKGACKTLVVPAMDRPDEDAAALGRRLRRIVEHYAADPNAVKTFATSTNSFSTIVEVPITPIVAATPTAAGSEEGVPSAASRTASARATVGGAAPPPPAASKEVSPACAVGPSEDAALSETRVGAQTLVLVDGAAADATTVDSNTSQKINTDSDGEGEGGGHDAEDEVDVLAETILPMAATVVLEAASFDDTPSTCPVKVAWTWRDNHFTMAVSGVLTRDASLLREMLCGGGGGGDGGEGDGSGADIGDDASPEDLLDPVHMAALRLEAPPIGRYLDSDVMGSCATLLPLEAMHSGVVQLRKVLCTPPRDVLDTDDDAVIDAVLTELGNACARSCGFTVNGAAVGTAGTNAMRLDMSLGGLGGGGGAEGDQSMSLRKCRLDMFEATLSAVKRRTVVLLQPIVIANCSSNDTPLCLPEDCLTLLSAAEGFQWLRMPPPLIGPSQCAMLAFRWKVDPYSVFRAEADRVMRGRGASGNNRAPPTKCQVLLSSFSLVDLPQGGDSLGGRSTYVVRIIATLTCEDIYNHPLVTTRIHASCLVDTVDDRHRQSVACFPKGLPAERERERGDASLSPPVLASGAAPPLEAMQYPCLMIPAGGAVPLHVTAEKDAPDRELNWLFMDSDLD